MKIVKKRKVKADTLTGIKESDYREQGLRILARIIVRKRLAEMKLDEAEHKCNDDENQLTADE